MKLSSIPLYVASPSPGFNPISMNTAHPLKAVEAAGTVMNWQPADSAPDVLARLRAFEEDGLQPWVMAGQRYYFASMDVLPWPDGHPVERRMEDVCLMFATTYSECGAQPEDVLYAATEHHGEVVIVPERFVEHLSVAYIELDAEREAG